MEGGKTVSKAAYKTAKTNKIKRSRADLIFDIILYTIGTILILITLYPMYFIVIASISDPQLVSNGEIMFIPRGVSLKAYVAKVTNISKTIEELKKEGMWFVCADMGGTTMYDLDLKGSIGLVIGNEGKGVSRLVKEKCDFVASIPMFGDIDSLNASVATGVLAYEIVRQRMGK